MKPTEFAITIPSFAPGIYSDDHVTHGGVMSPGGSAFVNGAATVANTYRCHADLTGALVPLPARVLGVSEPILPQGTGHSTSYYTGYQESFQEDIKVVSPAFGSALAAYTNGDDAIVAVMHGFMYDTTGVVGAAGFSFLYSLVRIYKETDTAGGVPPTIDAHFYKSTTQQFKIGTGFFTIPFGNFVHTVSHLAGQTPNQIGLGVIAPLLAWVECISKGQWPLAQFTGTAIAAADQALTTYDTDVVAVYQSDGDDGVVAGIHQSGVNAVGVALSRVGANIATALPDPNRFGPLHTSTTYLVAHQGRLVGCMAPVSILFNPGGNTTFSPAGEQLWFTYYPTYNLHVGTAALPDYAGQLVATPENSSGFGVVGSLNAQDLLIVHHYGGGAVVSGDLLSPTVNQLPNLHSTYGISSQGVNTPMGYIYGGRFGVYAYQSGQSQSISPQLGGFFWDHIAGAAATADHRCDGSRGRFAWWEPYILAPNNWLYDTENKSWWKLELPSSTLEPYSAYDTSVGNGPSSGKLYAMPWRKTLTSTVTYDKYDHYVLANTYSWQSQPLTESRDRMITPHRIEGWAVPAPGGAAASLTFTLTGVDETGATLTPFVKVVTLAAGSPRPQHFSFSVNNFAGAYVQLQIEASASAGIAAPKVIPGLNIICRDAPNFVTT